jgi:transcriptional regulator with XRE-family HTH domain
LTIAAHDDRLSIIVRGDVSIEKLSVRQIKAARELLAWSQTTLAEKSGVSLPTIMRLEARDGELGGRDDTREKIRSALERAYIEFLDDGGPGVRLRKPKRKGKL